MNSSSSDGLERYQTHEPENLQERYAHRAAHMKPSEIRSLFAVASRPEIVSLAGGMPNLSAIPMDMMAGIVEKLIRDDGQEALQYGSGQGHPHLREQICDVMALEGIKANPNDVLVTTGSQQALDLISRIFIDPGDVVLVEAPSYVGALGTFAQYEASVV
ncbi:MAG: aminotransferase class I/II-fold pyridoxal phosphate-dependent enzyme, partial [Actinobacteria bacterium]|nr:aminotransferase class I/II-fold pyridoxal phosphate-dependent enzyme [Actinomycetota bacterium]